MFQKISREKGITLIALIIIICILAILSSVTILMLKNNDLLENLIKAKNKYEISKQDEENNLNQYLNNIEIANIRSNASSLQNLDYDFSKTPWHYEYTGKIQPFYVPINGIYKLECWGASAGDGSAGGYSSGERYFSKGTILYITVGGYGTYGNNGSGRGGYNGGGNGTYGGGGATHISFQNKILKDLKDNKDQVIIVAGGAGGRTFRSR